MKYFNNSQGIVQGGIGSALAGGSVIGAMMAGPVLNKMGRRDSIMFVCFWWLLGISRTSFHLLAHVQRDHFDRLADRL